MQLAPLVAAAVLLSATAVAQLNRGYYRYPAIHGQTVVFTAEGDLWQAPLTGGVARRLTTHPGEETLAVFSPDGRTLAFTASYEGDREVYTMPAAGGLPARRTFGGATSAGWTPDGKLLVATSLYSGLPDLQLVAIDAENRHTRIPLAQAAQGSWDPSGKTLYFTRQRFQGSHAKRYQGGTAQNLWKFTEGAEAAPLTANHPGTSRDPMFWNGRLYFLSDRDGTMNLWSMDPAGQNLRQHTRHQGWDAKDARLEGGRVVYQLGADLHLFDISANTGRRLEIELASDFDHLRERWVRQPLELTTALSLGHDGSQIAAVSRGRLFVLPVKPGRIVELVSQPAARFRDAVLLPGGKHALALSTQSGEVELWKYPANGIGAAERLTTGGDVLRWNAFVSPDGKWAAHTDKNNRLWLLNLETKAGRLVDTGEYGSNSNPAFAGLRWSPDSRWLAFAKAAPNAFSQIFLYRLEPGQLTPLTTDRYNSSDPAWSTDGKWIYFASDRALRTVVMSPWGARPPEPHFDRSDKLYQVALRRGLRSPFEPADELNPDETARPAAEAKPGAEAKPAAAAVEVDLDGIAARLEELPVPPGNYDALTALSKRLCWLNRDRVAPDKTTLECIDIANKGDKPETLMEGVRGLQLSGDGKKMLIRRAAELLVVDAASKEAALKAPKTLADARVDLKDWSFSLNPQEEFREAYLDAWRLHRDYFYDPKMHGVDWPAMREKYLPLVDRVRDRSELNDVLAQLVSELSVLHTSVRGGDLRQGPDQIRLAALGARLERAPDQGGFLVAHIYQSDPDRPDKLSPLARPGVAMAAGDVIVAVNGRPALSAASMGELLRNQAGRPVLLGVRPAGKTEPRDVLVKPITPAEEFDLRYHEWEHTRRLAVEQASQGRIGYLHLRAMGPADIAQWVEHYTPVFHRQGLIVDVRHNGGGNIDSWLLSRLQRKAWMYWQPRVGKPYWNMQGAFRGHVVVLCDEFTASDGEAFAEGFRRLGLGKLIGTRTWGGEIWLTGSNVLADRGIATAAEMGVYGPDRNWLIEGHGVDPDIVVDNPPHATFNGKDAQLEAAIRHLEDLIKRNPNPVPQAAPHPDKSFKQGTR
jgi:tricorn protease